jgi:unsaturated rhamnogalacturonyl hydrolase
MMKRKQFVTSFSMGFPMISLGILPAFNMKEAPTIFNDPIIEKAMFAMLSMQRQAWEQGTASQALIAIGRKDLAILFAKDALVHQTKEGRLGILGSDRGATDPASNGEAVMLAFRETGDERFKKAADLQYNYLKNIAPKTEDGIIYHTDNAKQLLIDSSFMAPPFLALMGDYDESVKQYEGYRRYMFNKEKKLYHHRWDDEKKEFKRKLFWGGGNGWTAAGITKTINMIPADRGDLKQKLIDFGTEVIDGCLAFMRPDGLFHDIVDDQNTFIETNLGQMLAFSIYTGIKAGWLDKQYKVKADKIRRAARSKIDEFGIVQGACGSPDFRNPGTSTEAQAFYLLMESAYHSTTVN